MENLYVYKLSVCILCAHQSKSRDNIILCSGRVTNVYTIDLFLYYFTRIVVTRALFEGKNIVLSFDRNYNIYYIHYTRVYMVINNHFLF